MVHDKMFTVPLLKALKDLYKITQTKNRVNLTDFMTKHKVRVKGAVVKYIIELKIVIIEKVNNLQYVQWNASEPNKEMVIRILDAIYVPREKLYEEKSKASRNEYIENMFENYYSLIKNIRNSIPQDILYDDDKLKAFLKHNY